jgi:tetratricopeptide (TPR) repeat protein
MSDQPGAGPSNDLLSALESLIKGGAGPEELARRLFELSHDRARQARPELAELLRACALPQAIDATVIGALRDKPAELEANEQLLQELLAFDFVLPRQDGDYVYHDNTRDALLAWWRQPENRALFEIYQGRLVAFYERQGQACYGQGDYATALLYFNRAMALQTDEGRLHHWRGRTNLALGDYAAARAGLEQALALDFARPETYFDLATACYYLADYQVCLAHLTNYIELEPDSATAYNNRGLTHAKLGHYEQALADYAQAIQLNPQDATAYNNRGLTHAKLGHYEQALADYAQAIQLNPQDASAYYNTACAYARQQNVEAALPPLRRALELDPRETLNSIPGDSDFDAIRPDPRFQALLAEFSKTVE